MEQSLALDSGQKYRIPNPSIIESYHSLLTYRQFTRVICVSFSSNSCCDNPSLTFTIPSSCIGLLIRSVPRSSWQHACGVHTQERPTDAMLLRRRSLARAWPSIPTFVCFCYRTNRYTYTYVVQPASNRQDRPGAPSWLAFPSYVELCYWSVLYY